MIFSHFGKVETKKHVKNFLSRHEMLSSLIAAIFIILFAFLTFGNSSDLKFRKKETV